jgi:predicted protein tyrosine phosphatase
MKPVYALSWHSFCATMQHNKVDDSNIESRTSAIIEIMGEQDLLGMPFYFKEDHPNVIRLIFDDVLEDLQVIKIAGYGGDTREYIPVVVMKEEQGRQIVKFVRTNEKAVNFIIHCAAGVSRSGAVAKFINEVFGGTDREFHFLNPYVKPNYVVLNMLRNLQQTMTNPDDNT